MKFFETRRVNKTLKKIDDLKNECVKKHVVEARLHLERVAYAIQSPLTTYTYKKYKLVNNSLKNISYALDKKHINAIKYECDKTSDIVFDRYVVPSHEEELIMKSQNNINELQDALVEIDEKIRKNTAQMDECLGKDEITWKRLNAVNKNLKQKRALYKKQFDDNLAFAQNLEACNDARTLRNKYTDEITKQQQFVNTDEFCDNIDTMNYISEETQHTQDIISEKIFLSTNTEEDDEYRRACEEKLAMDNAAAAAKTMEATSEGTTLSI